jgi:hypothetical protein
MGNAFIVNEINIERCLQKNQGLTIFFIKLISLEKFSFFEYI